MSIIQGTAKSGGTVAASFYDYPIGDSLRFDGSSYLSRDYTSTNGTTQFSNIIFSAWAKMSDTSATDRMFLFATDKATNGTQEGTSGNATDRGGNGYVFGWDNNSTVYTVSYGGESSFPSTGKYRDPSAWYHLVLHIQGNSFKIYINNSLVVNTSADSTRDSFNFRKSTIGAYNAVNYYSDSDVIASFFKGYLANVHCIQNSTNAVPSLPSGASNWAEAFGETKDDIWVPKEYTGSYGTNGFHLDFADSSNIGNDVSGNNNDWTVN